MRAPLTLLHVFPTFAFGGVQVRFCALANHFGRRYRHLVVALDGDTACAARLDPGLDVAFPLVRMTKNDTRGNVARFRAALAQWRPDGLITSNWGSIEWDMARALPGVGRRPFHVHVEDGFGPEERDRQLPRRVLTRRLVLRRCITVLPSRRLWDIATGIWRLPESRLRYIPNGVDLARFGGDPPPPPWQQDGRPVVGTVAALRLEKNLARLVRAFAVARAATSARLVIVGDGNERAGLERLVGETGLGGDVIFTGHMSDPRAALRNFDVFVLSSDTEQMPMSVLEAMASGLPLASTDVGDVRAVLSAQNAKLIVPRDDAALAGAIGELLGNPALRDAVGRANRARAAADFTEGGMFAAWQKVFDGVA